MSIYNYTGSNNKYNTKSDPNYSGLHGMSKCMYESSLDYIKLDEAMLMSDFYELSLNRRDSVLESGLGVVNEGVIGNFFTALKNMLVALGKKIASVFTSVINAITGKTRDYGKELKKTITVDQDYIKKSMKRMADIEKQTHDNIVNSDIYKRLSGILDSLPDDLKSDHKEPQKLLQMSLEDYLRTKDLTGLELESHLVGYKFEIGEIKIKLNDMRSTINISTVGKDLDLDKMEDGRMRSLAKSWGTAQDRRNTKDYLMYTPDEYKEKYIKKFLGVISNSKDDAITFDKYYNDKVSDIESSKNVDHTILAIHMAIDFVSPGSNLISTLQDIRRGINKNIDIMKNKINTWEKEFGKTEEIGQRLQYLKAYVAGFDSATQILTNTGIRLSKDAMKQANSIIAKAKAFNPTVSKQENAILIYESVADVHDEMDELFAI